MAQEYLDTDTRKEQIASAVLAISAREGFSAVTIERVAGDIGLVPSAVYRHYPKKSLMIDSALELVGKRIQGNINAIRSEYDDPMDILKALMYRHVEFVISDLGAGGSFFTVEVACFYPDKKRMIFQNMQILGNEVQRCMDEALVLKRIRSDISVDQLVNLYLGLFMPAIMHYQFHGSSKKLKKTIDENWSMFCTLVK